MNSHEMDNPSPEAQVIQRLRLRAHRASRAQYLATKRCHAIHNRLGVPAVCVSTAVGTAIFGSLASKPSTLAIAITGALSLTAALFSALQTFFNFGNRAEKHRLAGSQYAAIKRRLDLLYLKSNSGDNEPEILQAEIALATEEFNRTEAEALDVSDSLYDRARHEERADDEGI